VRFKEWLSCVAVRTVQTARFMVPSVASSAIRNRILVVILLPALQASILLQQLLRLALLLHLHWSVINPRFLHFIIQTFIKLAQFLDSVGDAVPEVLE
jgi:hypothetical protein